MTDVASTGRLPRLPPTPLPPEEEEPGVLPRPARRGALAELRATASDLWRVRGLLYELSLRDLRVRYKQALFGLAWALLTPALVLFAGLIVRVAVARSAGRGGDAAETAAIAVKALPWSFFASAVAGAAGSLSSNASLLTKVYFPREVLPIAAVAAHLVDLAAGALAATALLAALGVGASPALLWVPPLVLLLVLLTVAASLVLSCANVFFRDVKYVVQVLLTFGIFFTPVLFEPAMLGPRLGRLVMLNPMSPIFEGLRLAVVNGHDLLAPLVSPAGVVAWRPTYLAYAAAWSVGGLLLALLLFARLERLFADYV